MDVCRYCGGFRIPGLLGSTCPGCDRIAEERARERRRQQDRDDDRWEQEELRRNEKLERQREEHEAAIERINAEGRRAREEE